ncbi:hypothetical protein AB0A74_14335 [Saccharothrix sp. NPDC042600]|uniref:hypothetical protein n=1 Tax=Saccharothrix TaxID=2071 RepID=UPI0033E3BFB7|nr:hypothetical protein GCM10017745_59550 [Saccharothrix mutabilis subsp. capreolus]
MTTSAERTSSRRLGYLLSVAGGVVALYLLNVWPGWRAVPVVTAAAREVVVTIDVVLAIGLVLNLGCVLRPRPLLMRAVDVVTTALGLAAVTHLRAVFPFAFADGPTDWAFITKAALTSIIVVVSIALVVQLVLFARTAAARERRP